jgi:hypothetical protein
VPGCDSDYGSKPIREKHRAVNLVPNRGWGAKLLSCKRGPEPVFPNYGRVRFANVYPGIDLVYYGKDGQLEYDWIVKPGAEPTKIRLKFEGIGNVRVDAQGDLVLETSSGEFA